jgi:hypothetical protein
VNGYATDFPNDAICHHSHPAAHAAHGSEAPQC